MQLSDFDIDLFLRDYWQKKPLLIRNPWAKWRNVLEPDELAGLACEEGIESRLIVQSGETWVLEHGPFAEDRFSQLDGAPWTLLVQAVDHYAPDVAALLDPFRFIPNWRIDDVMVSYATDGGGVGPHFDQYDVFLIQGLGKRRWRVGDQCDRTTPLRPHDDLRLLTDFEATGEWVLEPGDILYVPPGVAHDGVAVGDDCMTYSIGFRAPSRPDMLMEWAEHLVDGMADDDLYVDPDLKAAGNPGEIAPSAIDRLHAMAVEKLLDRDAFARWFGQHSSTPKYADADWRPDEPITIEELQALARDGATLARNPASRFAFLRQNDGVLLLFADGSAFPCSGASAALAEQLCAQDHILLDPSLSGAMEMLAALVNQGSLAPADDGDEDGD
ncbi:cupin domain-containing protein [Sphingobium sp. BYY-5]|uniref:cupin domain-containing protein n=1 Tax=Sphingobium sp. BYY-5 TaxID=2926400 RepID=UPI001FA7E40C|nr:cupin domain-containing protein [Sphingobium sp. BYY-5]MCI4589607.1 cupin domain-containing protein [Sphingobium sp. BYY-5]